MTAAEQTRLAFLREICEHPEDDAVRLVYADWLEENGEGERSEFVRVQCELAHAPEVRHNQSLGMAPSRRQILERRERELLEPTKGAWIGFVDGWQDWWSAAWQSPAGFRIYTGTHEKWGEVQFRRGFVAEVTLTAANWLAHADNLCWSPEQRCGECGGARVVIERAGIVEAFVGCSVCHGTGRRPFPETAQPIREVKLTTLPNPSDTRGFRRPIVYTGEIAPSEEDRLSLSMQWPSLAFALPQDD